MFTTSKRPRPTMRYPTQSLNPVRSSIVQDLRLLPIDSSLVYLAVSEYTSLSLCVFSGQVRVSSHVNQQEHVKQHEAAKPCQIGKIVCFLHSKMLPFKNSSGLNAPQTPTYKAPPFNAGYAPASSCVFSEKIVIAVTVTDYDVLDSAPGTKQLFAAAEQPALFLLLRCEFHVVFFMFSPESFQKLCHSTRRACSHAKATSKPVIAA